MTTLLPDLPPSSPISPTRPAHGLGDVKDDWEAAEVWLHAIASRPKKGSPETVATYRFHIAKLRWYCEHVSQKPPSQWTMPDVTAFFEFLTDLPDWAICEHDGIRHARADEPGYTPFRCQPSASSRSDVQRCIHAMFRAWREVGYIAMNPMGFHGAGTQRKVNAARAISLDLYDLVLETMGPQRVSVPLGPLLSRATVTNIARGEVTNGLLKLTNMSFSLTGQMTAPLTGTVKVTP